MQNTLHRERERERESERERERRLVGAPPMQQHRRKN